MAVGTENGKIHLFNNIENDIYGFYNLFSENILNNTNCIRSSVAINDLNNDGLPDLIRGNASGGIELFLGNEFNLQNKEELSYSDNIDLFPNPNSGTFNVKHNLNKELIVQCFSITGKLIYFSILNDSKNIIELNDIEPGVYILKIKNNKQVIQTKKLIISK
tara:strand:- start:206 stop:691 length:486 start_codon:yes stop_codon:yes gene_type:complete